MNGTHTVREVIFLTTLEARVREAAVDGRLPCSLAFSLAHRESVAPRAVREAADAAGLRIALCQLGLFGYEAYGDRRWARSLASLPEAVTEVVRARSDQGTLSCQAAWALAEELGLPRLLVGSVLETLGIRVSVCQLGCFG
ncbi:MAG: hypothetical protein AB1778_02160 [Candidatus Bipolaricaulota bacterium]